MDRVVKRNAREKKHEARFDQAASPPYTEVTATQSVDRLSLCKHPLHVANNVDYMMIDSRFKI